MLNIVTDLLRVWNLFGCRRQQETCSVTKAACAEESGAGENSTGCCNTEQHSLLYTQNNRASKRQWLTATGWNIIYCRDRCWDETVVCLNIPVIWSVVNRCEIISPALLARCGSSWNVSSLTFCLWSENDSGDWISGCGCWLPCCRTTKTRMKRRRMNDGAVSSSSCSDRHPHCQSADPCRLYRCQTNGIKVLQDSTTCLSFDYGF